MLAALHACVLFKKYSYYAFSMANETFLFTETPTCILSPSPSNCSLLDLNRQKTVCHKLP